MAYDKAERRWKITVIDESGRFRGGWLDPDQLTAQGALAWRSRPHPDHFQVLYQYAPERFAILYRYSKSASYKLTARDWFQEVTPRQALKWFKDEGHEIPAELRALRQRGGKWKRQASAPPVPGEWSTPMSKAEIMTRLKMKPTAFNTFAKHHGLKQYNRQLWQIRLDAMDTSTRRRIETGR